MIYDAYIVCLFFFTAVSSLPDDSTVGVVIIHKEPVDEGHIEVQKLIDVDYPEEESIRAIERWGTAQVASIELMREQVSDEILGATAPVQPKTNTSVYIYSILIYIAIYMYGVGCHWWFNYPGPLLHVELEFACLSG